MSEELNGTTSDKYRAELYDEVWQKARDIGYGNVTMALAELSRIKAGHGEAVYWLSMCGGHYAVRKTEESARRWAVANFGSTPIPLYTSPPSDPGTVQVRRELLDRIQKELDVYHARDLVCSFGVDDELRALLAQHEGVKQ